MASRRPKLRVTNPIDSDIDGTTKGVASVTLESDNPLSDKSAQPQKRRRRLKRMGRPTRMEWEVPHKSGSDAEASSNCSTCSGGRDADDEQSDWPDANQSDECLSRPKSTDCMETTEPGPSSKISEPVSGFIKPPPIRPSRQQRDSIPTTMKRRIERFLADSSVNELSISHTYRVGAFQIRRAIGRTDVEVVKRPRGTIVLRKTGRLYHSTYPDS